MSDLVLQQLIFIYGSLNVKKNCNVIAVKRSNCIIKFLVQQCNDNCQYEYIVTKRIQYPQNKENPTKELTEIFNNKYEFYFYPNGIDDICNIYLKTVRKGKKKLKYFCYTINRPCSSSVVGTILYKNNNSINMKEIFDCCYEPELDCHITTINHFMYNSAQVHKINIKKMCDKYRILLEFFPINDICLQIGYFVYQLGC